MSRVDEIKAAIALERDRTVYVRDPDYAFAPILNILNQILKDRAWLLGRLEQCIEALRDVSSRPEMGAHAWKCDLVPPQRLSGDAFCTCYVAKVRAALESVEE